MTEAAPVKRGPGRPRKTSPPVPTPSEPVPASAVAEEHKPRHAAVEPEMPVDPKIGQQVEDPRWTAIVFPDGAQYRVEAGVIVERVL